MLGSLSCAVMFSQPEAFWLAAASQGLALVPGSHRCHLKIVAPLAVSVSPTRGGVLGDEISGVGGSSAASAMPAEARAATAAASSSALRTLIGLTP